MKSVFNFLGSNLGFLGSSPGLSCGPLGLLGKSAQGISVCWIVGVDCSLDSRDNIIGNFLGASAAREHEVRVGEDCSLLSILYLSNVVAIGHPGPF